MKKTLKIALVISILMNGFFVYTFFSDSVYAGRLYKVSGKITAFFEARETTKGDVTATKSSLKDALTGVIPNLNITPEESAVFDNPIKVPENRKDVSQAIKKINSKTGKNKRAMKKALRKAGKTIHEKNPSTLSANLYMDNHREMLNIEAHIPENNQCGLFIITRSGLVKAFYEFPVTANPKRVMNVNLKGLESGDYSAHIVSGDRTVVKKFVKS